MICERPITVSGKVFGCGQCLPCRINKRRIWAHRILLESYCHGDNAFVTLTYDEDNVPEVADSETGELRLTLRPSDLQLWLKRFRKAVEPKKIRFFAVGEYGEITERPHYHVAVFGYPRCLYGNTRHIKGRKSACCEVCEVVDKSWKLGRVSVDGLEKDSAQYIAGYTVKKMTAKDDLRLLGREPEFARMSLRPGIGFNFMYEVASGLLDYDLDQKLADVPSGLLHGKAEKPLGRYLQRRLRVLVGKDEKAPKEVLERIEEELSALRQTAFDNSRSFAEEVANAGKVKRRQLEARGKLFKTRKTL